MKRSIALIPLAVIGMVNAGQPLHDVLKLRTVDILRCEPVTEYNVAEVSSFVRARSRSSEVPPDPSEVANSVSGLLVEGIVRRHRDVAFHDMDGGDSINDTQWTGDDRSAPLKFFVLANQADACAGFVRGTRVNVILSQRAECDTYPPTGICVFDYPIRMVDPDTWTKYGE